MSARTVVININGRNYSVSTEEPEELFHSVAADVEAQIAEFTSFLKNKSEAEVVTLVAFDNAKAARVATAENDGNARRLDEAQAIISDLTRKVDEAGKHAAELTAANGKLTADNAELTAGKTAITADNAKLTAENAALVEKAAAAGAGAAAVGELTKERDELLAKVAEVQAKYDLLEKNKDEQIQLGLASAMAEFDSISNAEHVRGEEQQKKYEDYEHHLESEIERSTVELAQRDKEITALKAEIAELKKNPGASAGTGSGASDGAGDEDARFLLAQYEKNFNDYVTAKEAEIQSLQKQVNAATEELARVKAASGKSKVKA